MAKGNCVMPDCERPRYKREWCNMHYQRGKKDGTIKKRTFAERFWMKVDATGDCWTWKGHLTDGYGLFYVKSYGGMRGAHRVSYEMSHGAIPEGIEVDHICHTRHCVRPDHLRLATSKQNCENKAGLSARNKSGVRGVYWHRVNKRWIASVGHNSVEHYAGSFKTLDEAEAAAKAKRLELFTHNVLDRTA